MGPLLQAELIKLRTTRTFIALIGVTVVLSLVVVVLQAFLLDPGPEQAMDVFNADFTAFFIMILAVVGITGEWRHRTITSSLLAAPDRWKFIAAKVLAYAVTGLVVSLLVTVVTSIVGSVILSATDEAVPAFSDILDLGWRNLLIAFLFGAFGIGLGGLIRNQPVAVVVILVDAFIVEFTLIGLVPDVGRFGPLFGLPTGIVGLSGNGQPLDDFFTFWPALGFMLVWIVVLVGGAGLLLGKRDVDAS